MKYRVFWSLAVAVAIFGPPLMAGEIVYDAEYYVLKAQHGDELSLIHISEPTRH